MAGVEDSKYTLMEESVLMCLRKDGDVSSGPVGKKCPGIAIVASIMMELALRDKLQQTGTDLFNLTNPEPTGDDVIDDAINIMKTAGPTTIDEWMKSLIGTIVFRKGIPQLEERIFHRLVNKKVLSVQKGLLGGESYPFYDNPEIDRITSHLITVLATPRDQANNLTNRDFCRVGLFHSLDKPFVYRPGNALDINRIYPDKDVRNKMRENVEALLQDNNNMDTTGVSESIRNAIIRRMIRITFLGAFNILTNL